MLLWVIFAVLTAAAIITLLAPMLARQRQAMHWTEFDLEIYRAQLREIESERARGSIRAADAEAARIEISRRIVQAAEASAARSNGQTGSDAARRRRIAYGIMILAPALSLSLYLVYGSPNLPGQPLAARLEAPLASQKIELLIAKVEERLREHPEDGTGWNVIAPVYLRRGRHADAAAAYERALRLLGETPERLGGLGEALALANNGIVTEKARQAFEGALRAGSKSVTVRLWLAIAEEQDGRLTGAARSYQALLGAGPPDPLRSIIEARLEGVNAKLASAGAPLREPRAPPIPPGGGPNVSAAQRGPTAEDIRAAQSMTGEQRLDMIGQMVSGLAERLKQNGADLGGWLKLVRAYQVLGKRDKALEAVAEARRHFDGNTEALGQIDALAHALGLNS